MDVQPLDAHPGICRAPKCPVFITRLSDLLTEPRDKVDFWSENAVTRRGELEILGYQAEVATPIRIQTDITISVRDLDAGGA